MKIIDNNPYRIIGTLSNSSGKELQRQKVKIKAFAKVGKEITSEYDFDFLNTIDRTEKSIEQAFSNIEQNQDKVNNSLFWFLKANPIDETAISYLIKGDVDNAIEVWKKITNNKKVNPKNFSAFNNIGTLKLLSKSEFEIKQGIDAKIKLIESECFENFVHTVADQTYIIDNQKQLQKLVDELLTQFKNRYSNADILDLFSNCKGKTQKYLSKKFTEEPMYNIESNIETTKQKRKDNKSDAYSFGKTLFKNTKDDLTQLKSLLGIHDFDYKRIADALANEIIQCGIDYFNDSQEKGISGNYLESAIKLTKLADAIAVGKLIKNKAKNSLITFHEVKDKAISQALNILNSIEFAFNSNIAKIYLEVNAKPMDYNQTINWSKVNKVIKNSLDWDKVVEQVVKTIPPKNVEKIKMINNTSKLNEYKSLVVFLIDKLNYSQKNKVKYLCYWKTEDTISKIIFILRSIPSVAKWLSGFAIFLLVAGLIWGVEVLFAIFAIVMILFFLLDWFRNF